MQRPIQPPSSYQQQPSTGVPQNPTQYPPRPNTANYRDPPPIEVYTLPDAANLSIPAEIRERYQRDEFGRVLFFTTPPVASNGNTGEATGHSVRYLAAKARRAEEIAKRRQERDLQKQQEERVAKKARLDAQQHASQDIDALKRKALGVLEKQLAISVDAELGDAELASLTAAQKSIEEKMQAVAVNERKRSELRKVRLGEDVFADDYDNRIT